MWKAKLLSRILGGAVGTGSQDTGPLEAVDKKCAFVPWETKGHWPCFLVLLPKCLLSAMISNSIPPTPQ